MARAATALCSRVERVGTSKGFIYGYVRPSPQSEVSVQQPGWFILDASTHKYVLVGESSQSKWETVMTRLELLKNSSLRVVR